MLTVPATRRISSGPATVLPAATMLTFLAASSAPTPLYRVYQAHWAFSSGMLTVIFGVYAVCLLLALLTVGSLSDHVGRRPVILGALALDAVAMLAFSTADGVPLLIAARMVQGIATGAATGALAAAILDAERPHGPIVNSVAPIAGLAVGGLGSAALVQFLPWPRQTVYLVLLVVFAIEAIGTIVVTETSPMMPGARQAIRPNVGIPAAARSAFAAIALLDIAAWALGGFYLSLGPSLVRVVTGSNSILLGGLLVFTLAAAGAAAIWLLRAVAAGRVMRFGAAALAIGVAVTIAATQAGSQALLFAGTLIAGTGFGASFQGVTRTVFPLAPAAERGKLVAAFYVLSYLAFAIPAVAAGVIATSVSLLTTATGYGVVLIALAVTALIPRRPR
ncbi:MFS transporter [Streptomyces rugosispiralis]|uniref:MFS transporter n=1 Tax=Streptomyces rugosispiralis TaxID=2967341 RepID=A0ABT1UNH2_9ACTN|nr:MFS transporter [Streptomyces rugosispiralis]MCQ8186669.1 MFS transporter [Streptomyces rugosispiralis]